MTFALVIAFAAGLFIRRIRKRSRAKIVAAPADDLPEFIQQEEKEWELAEDDPGLTVMHRSGTYVMSVDHT